MKPKETSPLAIASLAFSCLGALTLGLLAIPGIVCGCLARNQADRGEYEGRSLAQAGIIVGIAVLIVWLALPMVIFGGAGAVFLAVQSPWVAAGIFAVMILLALMPLAFTNLVRHRDSTSLRRLVDQNRSRS